ncbi:HBR280Wp [Eremothecium sinecaudum]|uniref:HBR280Wp n=1 Tax=Eremothecium sinecaudum TaxID=45286 RepID=A0A109UX54_9SACH|nr:HBR280Wp [Eremothecium sinecaudum]AMD19181.1 HBR280Wp [Eremothecium sinecaudum]
MIILLYILASIQYVSCLHYYAKLGNTKCFYEDLSKESILIGNVDFYVESGRGNFIPDPNIRIEVLIYETFNMDEKVFSQPNLPLGEFTFTAMNTGEHRICLTPISSIKQIRVRISIEMAVRHADILDSKRMTDVSYLKNRVVYLINRLEDLRREQATIRADEEEFIKLSELVKNKIIHWAVAQTAILFGVWLLQLRFLRNYFAKRKKC